MTVNSGTRHCRSAAVTLSSPPLLPARPALLRGERTGSRRAHPPPGRLARSRIRRLRPTLPRGFPPSPRAFRKSDSGRPTCLFPPGSLRGFLVLASSSPLFPGNPSLWVPSVPAGIVLTTSNSRPGATQLDRGAFLGITNNFTEH